MIKVGERTSVFSIFCFPLILDKRYIFGWLRQGKVNISVHKGQVYGPIETFACTNCTFMFILLEFFMGQKFIGKHFFTALCFAVVVS